MADLTHIPGKSALDGMTAETAPTQPDSDRAIQITDCGLMTRINLRCDAENPEIKKRLQRLVGTTLPQQANRFNQSGDRAIIWLGPDEWLILAEDGAAASIIAELDIPEAGHVAVTDVSDALGGIGLQGAAVRQVLAKHCALDFHASSFTTGMAAQSLLSHASVIIQCLDDQRFMVTGRSSFMPYILELLKDAAVEYGYQFEGAA